MDAQHTRGYLVGLIAAIILSTTAIFIRHLTTHYDVPPLVLAFWRNAMTTLVLGGLLAWRWPALLRVDRRHLRYLAGYGVLLAVFNSLWTLAISRTGASVATVLVYSSTGFTVLLAWWLLDEPLTGIKMLAVGCSLGGCVLVARAYDPAVWDTNLLGIVTGVLSGVAYAGYHLMGRSASQRGLNPWTTLLYTFGGATLVLLFFNLQPVIDLPGSAPSPGDMLWLGDSLAGWGWVLALAAGPTLTGYGLINVTLAMLPSSVASLVLSTEPAYTAILALFLFDEVLNGPQIAGAVLIMVAVVALRLFEGRGLRRRRRAFRCRVLRKSAQTAEHSSTN